MFQQGHECPPQHVYVHASYPLLPPKQKRRKEQLWKLGFIGRVGCPKSRKLPPLLPFQRKYPTTTPCFSSFTDHFLSFWLAQFAPPISQLPFPPLLFGLEGTYAKVGCCGLEEGKTACRNVGFYPELYLDCPSGAGAHLETFVVVLGRPRPTFRSIFEMYCSFHLSNSVRDVCARTNPHSLGIDERFVPKHC